MQFAVNPETEEILVIEMNPRVSRSSALASKATGFPIAKIAARLAVGYALEEIDNDITAATPAAFEPTIDYVVVKWPRFAFEKFRGADAELTTHMKSVGEAMAIGRTFQQAFGKAMRSRELDRTPRRSTASTEELLDAARDARTPTATTCCSRCCAAARRVDEVRARTGIDPWFLRRAARARAATPRRRSAGERTFKAVDTCAAEFEARTPYYYSGWERRRDDEVERGDASQRDDPRLGPEPHRPGHRVRLLLRARGDDRARARAATR